MKKLTKFFMACGVAFVVGLVMFAVGFGTGGVEGFDKVAEDHDWINGSPGDRTVAETAGLEFESIEVTGVTDVVVAGEKYYNSVAAEYELDKVPEPGTAVMIYGDNLKQPDVDIDGKTLTIQGMESENSGINLDFSSADAYPTVIVFCDDEELGTIKSNSEHSDISLLGISFEKADIQLNFGDVEGEDIESKGLNIKNDMGDVELSGDLKGETVISLESGDIELDVLQKAEEYTIEAETEVGDIKVGEKDVREAEGSYSHDGGKDLLKLKTESGDISIGQIERL